MCPAALRVMRGSTRFLMPFSMRRALVTLASAARTLARLYARMDARPSGVERR